MALYPETTTPQPGLPSNPLSTFSNNLAGSWMDMIKEAGKSDDPFTKMLIFNSIQTAYNSDPERMRQQLEVIKKFEDERALKTQELGMQSNIFGGLLKTIADTPKQIAAARQMYGPETSTNFIKGLQAFGQTSQPPRYF
jgi:hypothetical protein